MFTIAKSFVLLLWTQTFVFVKCQDCTLEQFLKSTNYDENFETSGLAATYGPGKQVRVPCKIGFTGFFKLVCSEGKWLPRGSVCEIKSCGHPGDTPFGDFRLEKKDDFVYGSQVVYECQRGYHMVSRSNIRRCQAEGWDGVVPVCEAIRCPSITLPEGVQVVGDLDESTFGNVVQFSCRSNNQVLEGSPEMFCTENGEWRGTVPECKEIECDAPVIEHGSVEGDRQQYNKDDLLSFRCDRGYKKADDRSPKCLKLGQRGNAEWAPKPACKEITCELSLPPLMGTTYNTQSKSVFSPGEKVQVTCGEGYWIINTRTTETVVTCKANGEWDVRPVCQEVTCSAYLPDDHLSWSTTRNTWGRNRYGDTVTYSCARSYVRTDGVEHATCTRDGWTPKPLCQAPCPAPNFENADMTHGVKYTYYNNDQVQYRCKTGNQESFTATCRVGTWTESRSCAATSAPCPHPSFENAVVTEYNSNDQVRYRCQTGDQESFTAVCKEGTWTESRRCAVCPKPQIEHGFAVGSFDNKVIYYSCNENYKLSAKSWWDEATCVDGEWSALRPCIVETECGEAPVISNGRATKLPGRPARLEIVCDEGYRPETTQLTCLNGEWNLEQESICKPVSKLCEPPPPVENAVITERYQKEYLSDSSVTYQCRKNYMINGGETIRCNDGAWEKKTISCVRYCENLEDGKLMITSDVKEKYMEGESIDYRCNADGASGAVIRGTASCVSGSWSKSIECPALPCTVGDLPTGLGISGDRPANNQVSGGQTLRFFCPDEYHLEGSADIECLETGDWKESFPTCSKKCEILELPVNVKISEPADGRYSRRKGEILTFGCLRGLSISGQKTIECLNGGVWSGQAPTCERITLSCTVGDLPKGLVISGGRPANNQVTGGQILRFFCPDDHHLQGAADIECLETGEWNKPFPTCSRHGGCGSPPLLTDGDTVGFPKPPYEDGATVQYTCLDKYTLKGVSFKTCVNGVWTGQMTCKKPCIVNAELMNRHNVNFAYGDRNKLYAPHEDHLTFVCKRGTRQLYQEQMRKQCIDGQMDLPTCG